MEGIKQAAQGTRRRHKWEKKVNHSFCHEYVCLRCGCVKDATVLFSIVYWIELTPHATSPPCEAKKNNCSGQEKDGSGLDQEFPA